MSGALVVSLWLVTAAVPEVSAPAEAPRPQLLEVGAGVAAASTGGLSSLVVVDFEKPVFVSQAFFVSFTLKADWRHQGSEQYALNGFDVLAGLRLGVQLGSAFELFFGFGAGAAGAWSWTSQTFHGWWINDQFGVGFQAGLGARLRLGERISLFLVPAELLGGFWPMGGWAGNHLAADFTAFAGLSVRL